MSFENNSSNIHPSLQKLQDYLNLSDSQLGELDLLKVKEVGAEYHDQIKGFSDDRIKNIELVIVPDKMWHKGSQESESDPAKNLILFKKSYFENKDKPDEIAWLSHEFAHCQEFLNSINPQDYEDKMNIPAYFSINTEFTYPNNLIEREAFLRQFQFLKEKGKSRIEILDLISNYYSHEDLTFFEKVLDEIY